MSRALVFHYIILLLLLLGAGILIVLIPDNTIHWTIVAFIGIAYLLWAVLHHHQSNTLTRQAVLEYLCIIGLISLVLLLI